MASASVVDTIGFGGGGGGGGGPFPAGAAASGGGGGGGGGGFGAAGGEVSSITAGFFYLATGDETIAGLSLGGVAGGGT